jgi:hypothetical protein
MLPPSFNQLQLELLSKLAQMGTSKEYESPIGTMFLRNLHRKSIIHYPIGKWTKDSPLFTPNTTWEKKTP